MHNDRIRKWGVGEGQFLIRVVPVSPRGISAGEAAVASRYCWRQERRAVRAEQLFTVWGPLERIYGSVQWYGLDGCG